MPDILFFECRWKTPEKVLNVRPAKDSLPQQRRFYLVRSVRMGGGATMTTLQAICLGAMLAWTPSLVLLAWLLRDAPLLDEL